MGCGWRKAQLAIICSIICDGGCPDTVSGVTVNRFCSSGLQTIAMAASLGLTEDVPMAIGAGIESISLVTMGSEYEQFYRGQLNANSSRPLDDND